MPLYYFKLGPVDIHRTAIADPMRDPKNRFEKAPVVVAAPTRIAGLAGKKRRDPLPLRVAQNTSNQGSSPFSNLESKFQSHGNPEVSVRSQNDDRAAVAVGDLIETGLS
jgi:hypothetical protein